jgi:hypothetical protein
MYVNAQAVSMPANAIYIHTISAKAEGKEFYLKELSCTVARCGCREYCLELLLCIKFFNLIKKGVHRGKVTLSNIAKTALHHTLKALQLPLLPAAQLRVLKGLSIQ